MVLRQNVDFTAQDRRITNNHANPATPDILRDHAEFDHRDIILTDLIFYYDSVAGNYDDL